MTFLRACLLACIIAFSWPSLQASALDIDVSSFKLANGMEVVVIPDHRAPVVTHMVWYRAGAADEPPGEAGVAHFLEHLLFKGTPKVPAGQFSLIVRKNGGEDNAFTTQDYTAYFQKIAKEHLGLVMELEADRMQNLILTDREILPERQVILEERRERVENDPQGLLGEQLSAAMYTAHPYGKPVIGWRNQMEALTKEDAISFYKKFYTPANAILVVAGDVTKEEVQRLAEQHYGVLKNTLEPVERVRDVEPDPVAARRVIMTDPRAATPLFQRSYLAPSYVTGVDREAEALDILAEVLGGGSSSRLYKKLVVQDQLAAYVAAWFSGDSRDYGSFGVYGSPNPGKDVKEVEAAVDAEIAEVLKSGITADELEKARKRLLASAVYALDSQGELARIFGAALANGQTVEDILSFDERLNAVTLDDVKAAAAKVLDIRRSVTGIMLPAPLASGAAQSSDPQPSSTTVN